MVDPSVEEWKKVIQRQIKRSQARAAGQGADPADTPQVECGPLLLYLPLQRLGA